MQVIRFTNCTIVGISGCIIFFVALLSTVLLFLSELYAPIGELIPSDNSWNPF